MNTEPNPFEPRNESERGTFERSREEVEQMNADFERQQRILEMNRRLGSVASKLSQQAETPHIDDISRRLEQ